MLYRVINTTLGMPVASIQAPSMREALILAVMHAKDFKSIGTPSIEVTETKDEIRCGDILVKK